MDFSSSELRDLRKRGFWVGPEEREELFSKRVALCTANPPSSEIDSEDWRRASERAAACFGFSPDWIETRIEKGGLLFAGEAEVGCGVPVVRMGERVWRRGRPVPRDELLAHEWFHAARMAFEEPRFEEVIAFQTSRTSWRRLLSPLIQSTGELLLVALVSLATPLMALMGLSYPLLPLFLLFLFLGVRLSWRHWLWRRTSSRFPLHLAAQLTDREIRRFAFMNPEEIWESVRKDSSLRWRQILACKTD